MNKRLYVGNLPYSVTEGDLKDEFGRFGSVKEAKVIIDKGTGQSKGFGFVEFEKADDAVFAEREMNDAEFKGRKLKVNEARMRE